MNLEFYAYLKLEHASLTKLLLANEVHISKIEAEMREFEELNANPDLYLNQNCVTMEGDSEEDIARDLEKSK